MTDINCTDAKIFTYSFDVAISRPAADVWPLLSQQIDAWWMKDFRALGGNSVMSLDPSAGGSLLETGENGDALEWYRVQMCVPGQSLYLVGYMAPDWGGPTTSMLKLALKEDDGCCVLAVSDALTGNVTENKAKGAKSGWGQLFGEGLKALAEK